MSRSTGTASAPRTWSARWARWLWLAAGVVVLVTAAGLVTGADWLHADPAGIGLPLGTLATALSLTALPALALPWAVGRWTRSAAWLLIAAGALWLPVSALLAGNLRLAFTDGPDAWWTITRALPLLGLLLVLSVVLRAALARR